MTEKAFFSYSRSDSAFVLKLAKDLRDAGAELWLDQLDIKAGSHWDSSIEAALNAAPCLIVILSPASVASHNVMDEVSFALENGKKVIPVMLSECKPPFRLRRLQRIDFTGDYQTGLKYLLTAIGYDGTRAYPEKSQESSEKENTQTDVTQKDLELEKLLWQKAKVANNVEVYRHYIDEYPEGIYYTEAQTAIKEIEAAQKEKKISQPVSYKKTDKPVAEPLKKGNSKKYLIIAIAVAFTGVSLWILLQPGSGKKNDKQETVAWNTALQKNDSSAFADYIREFPKGSFISQAKEKLDSISKTNATNLLSENNQTINNDKILNDSLEELRKKRIQDSLSLINNKVKSDTSGILKIGQNFGGGIIFYIDKSGRHGLIAAPNDLGFMDWTTAQKKCKALNLDGFTGWRLPTKEELKKICSDKLLKKILKVKVFDGGDNSYWCSNSYIDPDGTAEDNRPIRIAWQLFFDDNCSGGEFYANGRSNIRAVRAF